MCRTIACLLARIHWISGITIVEAFAQIDRDKSLAIQIRRTHCVACQALGQLHWERSQTRHASSTFDQDGRCKLRELNSLQIALCDLVHQCFRSLRGRQDFVQVQGHWNGCCTSCDADDFENGTRVLNPQISLRAYRNQSASRKACCNSNSGVIDRFDDCGGQPICRSAQRYRSVGRSVDGSHAPLSSNSNTTVLFPL